MSNIAPTNRKSFEIMFDTLRKFLVVAASHLSSDCEASTQDHIGPNVNIDGTPMIGSLDANGMPFGISASHDHESLSHDSFSPAFNIDGTPMCGITDINGNFYGVTSSHDSSHDFGSSSCLSSDMFSSGSCSSDSFSSFDSSSNSFSDC